MNVEILLKQPTTKGPRGTYSSRGASVAAGIAFAA
jgi:hypothetical protein